MPSKFPAALDALPTDTANEKSTASGAVDPDYKGPAGEGDHAKRHNDVNDAVNKVEAEIGVEPSGGWSTLAARLAALDILIELLEDALATKQPLDADLSAIAAGGSTTFGRSLLTSATPAALLNIARVDAATEAIARRFMRVMTEGLRDCSIVVVGDSTSAGTAGGTTWSAKLLDGLHALFPAYTIKFADWSDAEHKYPATTEKYKGTGALTLTLWNCAVNGKNTNYQQAPYFDAMIASKQPDLIFLSHGHNHGGEGENTVEPYWRDDLTAMTELLNEACPRSEIVLFAQNPRTDGSKNVQALRQHVTERIAQLRGYGFVNVHRLFIDAAAEAKVEVGSLLADALHPNATGYNLIAEEVLRLMNLEGVLRTQQPSSFSLPATNLLTNGILAQGFVEGSPNLVTGWTLANVTVSKNETAHEGNGFSVKQTIVTPGVAGRMKQVLSANDLKKATGRWVCLSARVLMAAGRPGGAGRISIQENGGSSSGLTQNNALVDGDDGFKWAVCARRISIDATGLEVFLNCDPAGGAGVSVSYDRATLARGILPRDVR